MELSNNTNSHINDSDISKKELFEAYDKKIDELYKFRDTYYMVNENSKNPEDRNQELMVKLNEIVYELENVESSKFESKASYLILIGRAFNVLPEYNQKAFDSLTKAVSLSIAFKIFN